MRNLRRVVQLAAFGLYVYLFLATVGRYDPTLKRIALASEAPIDTFFRIDPLLALTAMLSTRRIIEVMLLFSVPVVVLTLVAGRFFCGWICPLGTCLDAARAAFFRARKAGVRRSEAQTSRARQLKYYVLFATLSAAIVSAQLAYLLDPITIITRAFTFALFPIVQLGIRALAGVGMNLSSPWFPSDVQYYFRFNFLAAAVFVTIIGLSSFNRRWWCRNLCPLGALLAVISKVSIIRRQVDRRCSKCSKCIPDCKMGAIPDDPTQYQATECIYCYNCTHVCPTLATRIAPSLRREGYRANLDLNRRRTVQALGIGALVAVLGKTNVAAKTSRVGKIKTSSEALIRPPGALPEDEFINRCIRCSECMKVCPTGGLQPALSEAGFAGLWTPVLVPRIGECTQNCNLCSQVCSTQAIQPFDISEKSHIYIGRAVIDRSHCIAWNSDRKCLVCDEHCSYHAVYWREVDGVRRPFVDDYKCVGCGICENACPIQPVAAIRIFSFGDRRYWTREQQKAFFEQGAKSTVFPNRPTR
ncbi:MAG: 4Fe-4S binding protein [Armatimonadota bacterium]